MGLIDWITRTTEDEKALALFEKNKKRLTPIKARAKQLVKEKDVIIGISSELNEIFIKFIKKHINKELVHLTSGELKDIRVHINDIEIYGSRIVGRKAVARLGIIKREIDQYPASRKLDKMIYSEFQKYMDRFFDVLE